MRAAVIGASGGIGAALVQRLVDDPRYAAVYALARHPVSRDGVVDVVLDIEDEGSVRTAAAAIEGPLDLLIIATGLLHLGGKGPERSLRDLDPAFLARTFAVNTIGPALALKHLTPLLPRKGRGVVAALSARVGSVSDNHLGGWYGYRASKAALNMVMRCASIELARSRPDALCVGLHPGTVDTRLSAPFQTGVPAGKLFTAEFAAERLLSVIDALQSAQSGRCFDWNGQEIAP